MKIYIHLIYFALFFLKMKFQVLNGEWRTIRKMRFFGGESQYF